MKTNLKLNATQTKRINNGYNGAQMSVASFTTDVYQTWNELIDGGSDPTPSDLTEAICTTIFTGVKNGTLYLASGKTGVDWSLLGRAFVGLASYDEISPGIRAAWLVMKKGKLNTGTLDTVKRVFGVEPKPVGNGGNTTTTKAKTGDGPTFTLGYIGKVLDALAVTGKVDKKTVKLILATLAK
jgi:hypothetical protein